MSAVSRSEELAALSGWNTACDRTSLVARMLAASVVDYRETLDLPQVILSQLDRFEVAQEAEHAAHDLWEKTRGAA